MQNNFFLFLLCSLILSGLTACMSTQSASDDQQSIIAAKQPKLLADMPLQPIVVEQTQLADADLSLLREGYANVLALIEAPELKRQIAFRLADIEMLLAEQNQVEGTSNSAQPKYYQQAIDTYQQLLQQYPDDKTKMEVLYQLSRAYDLQGQGDKSAVLLSSLLQQQGNSIYASEAWFRKGETLFAQASYADAADAYRQVLTEPDNDFYPMAAYMLGWSHFKLEEYQAAISAFDQMLKVSFTKPTVSAPNYGLPQLTDLSKGQQKVVADALRVMAMLFSYLGDADAILTFYAERTPRYQYLVFDELAQQHLNDDRYRDSASAYLAFAEHQPLHELAAEFYIKHIDAYILGDFPSLVNEAKKGFVNTYGLQQGLWSKLSSLNQEKIAPYLHQYLQELAQTEHSLAQLLSAKQQAEPVNDTVKQQSEQAYASAARYYQEFIATFPEDPLRIQMQFYLAESLYESKRFLPAIEQYQDFAQRYPEHQQAADAAYMVLLAYKSLLSDSTGNDEHIKQQQLARQDFVESFSQDARALPVAMALMQESFDADAYTDAIHWSHWLTAHAQQGTYTLDAEQLLSINLVEAHSQYGLQNFAAAQISYQNLLVDKQLSSKHVSAIQQNLALSLFAQAQQAVTAENLPQALTFLEQIILQTPNNPVRINAQFDAATYQIQLEQWSQAQTSLLDFQQRFSQHQLSAQIPEKLLFVYEQSEQWQPAAELLRQQWQQQPDTQTGQESLYLAADYFMRAGLTEQSRLSYRKYAHRYPEPFELVTEARFNMSEFYQKSGEDNKRRFWLKKLLDGHTKAGDKATARSQTLAAMSAMVFADDAGVVFKKVKLSLPLKTSLAKKRQALEKAIQSYQAVIALGVKEYSSAANHKLGDIYRILADDLLNSSRPKGLSALELAQYDLLLEEQAFPFEEQAIDIFETNAQRSWHGDYDEWVANSFSQLAKLLPGRYAKQEELQELSLEDY